MHYIAEFTRSKPIAVCVALNVPDIQLPLALAPDNGFSKSRNWRKNWRTQMDRARQATDFQRKTAPQSHYQGLLEELVQALDSVCARLLLGTMSDPDIADRLSLIQDLCTLGRYADASRYLEQTIELQILSDGNDSLDLAHSYRKLAHMQLASGHGDANHNAQKARDIYISNLGHNHPHGFECDLILADMALRQEDLTVVQDIASDILARAGASQSPVPLAEARALHLLALVAGIQRKLPLALENAQKASTLVRDSAEDDPSLLPKYRAFEGILYRKMAKWDEASACFEQAYDRLRTLLPDHHLDMGRLILEEGRFHMLKEDLEQATKLLTQAQGIFTNLKHIQLERLITATFRARLYRMGGHFKLANKMIRIGRRAIDKLPAANPEWQFRMELEQAHIMRLDGKYAEAESSLQALLHNHPPFITPFQQGELHHLLGQVQWQRHNLDDAKSSLRQALHFLQNPLPVAEALHLQTRVLLDLAELSIVERDPDNARQAVQNAQHNLALHTLEREWLTGRSTYLKGRIAMMDEDYPQAQSHFEQALANLKSSAIPRDNLSASCQLWLAQSLLQSGHGAGAVDVLQPMVDSHEYEHLVAEADQMRVFCFLAEALFAEGAIDTAYTHSQHAYKWLGKLPEGHLTHEEEHKMRRFMGSLHLQKNEHQSAINVLLPTLLAAMDARLSPTPASTASLHDQLAQAYLPLGQLAEAEAHWRQCLTLYQQAHVPTSLHRQVRAKLAEVLERRGQWDQALHEYLATDQHSPSSQGTGEQLCRQYTIARLQYHLGRMDQAQARLEQLVSTPARLQEVNMDPLPVFLLLGRIHKHRQQPRVAQTVLQDALTRFGAQSSDDVIVKVHRTLAKLMEENGDLAAAIDCWQQALERHETQGEPEPIWQCLQKLIRLSWRHRQREVTIEYSNKALKLAADHPVLFKKPHVIRLYLDLGEKYATLNKPSEALKCYARGVELANVKRSRKHVPLAAQCLLAAAALLTPPQAEKKHQQVQKLYKPKEIQPDTTLAQSCMKHGLLLWERNELEKARQAMTSAHDAHQHVVAAQVDHVSTSHSQKKIMITLQYLILLHADLGQSEQALRLLEDQLHPRVQSLPRESIPRQLSLATVKEQIHLLGSLPV